MRVTRRILGIDPGPKKSGIALLETSATERDPVGGHNSKLVSSNVLENRELMRSFCVMTPWALADEVTIEMMGYQNQNPGADTFWSLVFIGSLVNKWDMTHSAGIESRHLISRTRIRAHLVGAKGGDAEICKALAARFHTGGTRGARGTKKSPGPLFGLGAAGSGSHDWQALAVAVALAEGVKTETPPWEGE